MVDFAALQELAQSSASLKAKQELASNGRRVVSDLVSQVCRLKSVVAAFKKAALDDEPRTLYWPDLIEIIEGLLPDEDEIDSVLVRAMIDYEDWVASAEEAARKPKARRRAPVPDLS